LLLEVYDAGELGVVLQLRPADDKQEGVVVSVFWGRALRMNDDRSDQRPTHENADDSSQHASRYRRTRTGAHLQRDSALVTSQFSEEFGDLTVGRRDHGPLRGFTVVRPEIDSRGLSLHAADRSEGEWRYRHVHPDSPRELRCRAAAIRRVVPLDHDRHRGPAYRVVVAYPAAGR